MREINEQPAPLGIRHGDMVKVMSGRSKNPSKNIKGGILEKEGPLNVSNVMLICPGCGKHTRVGHTALPNGTKVRTCRRCNTAFEN